MIDNLEKPETWIGLSDLVNDKGAVKRVNAREVDCGDDERSGQVMDPGLNWDKTSGG